MTGQLIKRTEYGENVNVQQIRDGDQEEYRVCIGNFAVKRFMRKDEADAHAARLAHERKPA